jgi:hypothetical protein
VAAGFGAENLLNNGREAAIRWRSEEWLLSASQKVDTDFLANLMS